MKILSFLKQTYLKMPRKIQVYVSPFVAIYKKVMQFFLPLYFWDGKSKSSLLPLSVAYVGYISLNQNYYLELIFSSKPEIRYQGKFFFNNIFNSIRKKNPACSMVLWEPTSIVTWYLRNKLPFIIPNWVQMEIDISHPLQVMEKQKRTGYENFKRLIRKYEYSYILSKNTNEEFEDFYKNMYIPYAKYRFGDCALIPEYDKVFDPSYRSELFLIRKKNQIVAGCIVQFKDDIVNCHALGVKKNCFEMTKQGVLGTVYIFIIQELQKRGYQNLHVGGVRAMWNDGVTRLKVRLMATISENCNYTPNRCTYLSVMNNFSGIRDFLEHNPFVHLAKNGKLAGAIWISNQTNVSEEGFRKVFKRMERAGIQHCNLHTLQPVQLPSDLNLVNSPMTVSQHIFINKL
jgi:hypothetical protein